MLDFAFFYYVTVCSIAILLNLFIIFASTRPYVRGEFKWVFLGAAGTNTLLSISQLILMPSTMKWPGRNEYSVIATSNPLVQQGPRELCELLFDFLYFRQWEAVVLSICIVPMNRAIAVCWKHVAPTNAKVWILIAAVPNLLSLFVALLSYHLGMTRFEEVVVFPPQAVDMLVARFENEKYCTLKSNYRKAGDVATTAFLIFCPLASYSITIYCVVKLFLFIRHSKVNVRSAVSRQVMHRQKSILATICIQAAVPLVTYLPLLLSLLIVDNSWGISSTGAQWYDMSGVHYAAAWGPAIDALATVTCLKPYRRAFLELFKTAPSTTDQKTLAFRKTVSAVQNQNYARRSSQHSVTHEMDIGQMRARDSTIESFVDVRSITAEDISHRPVSISTANNLRETRV